jgi:hypothetical protein
MYKDKNRLKPVQIEQIRKKIKKNRRLYNEAFEKFMNSEMLKDEFWRIERKLEKENKTLRSRISEAGEGFGGACCMECGLFYNVKKANVLNVQRCKDHRGLEGKRRPDDV